MSTPGHAQVADRNTFGFWVYLMSDVVLFATLFATYAVFMHATFGGPSARELADLPFVFTETMLLLTSSFTMGLAVIAAQARKKNVSLALLLVTLLLGISFLGMEVYEFAHLIAEGHGPNTSAFLSAFFTLVGTHGLHVALGSIWMLLIIIFIAVKGLGESVLRKLTLLALFWHFLDIIWIFIFTFVYLFGAIGI
jgi:cytochrome o ubiquinol oxidase subunit III